MQPSFWLTLSYVKGVGDVTVKKFYRAYPFFTESMLVNQEVIQAMQPAYRKMFEQAKWAEAKEKALATCYLHAKQQIQIITIADEYYPKSLLQLKDPPAILYAKGNIALLNDAKRVAIVGTRQPTSIGIKSALKIAATFAEQGYIIVSGLALGIDTAAHEGALRVDGGKTIAVLAGDVATIYPAQNQALAAEILRQGGLLLSENPIGTRQHPSHFTKRNRIQSGLSLGVCVVQTPLKGGTQQTIRFAKEQGRVLFTAPVLPQDTHEHAVQGNLQLIDEGVFTLANKDSYAQIIVQLSTIQKGLWDY